MVNLPSRRVPPGITLLRQEQLPGNPYSHRFQKCYVSSAFQSIPVRWVNSPLAKAPKYTGQFGTQGSQFELVEITITPVRMHVRGSAGYFCTKCSFMLPIKRTCLVCPISAHYWAEQPSFTFHFECISRWMHFEFPVRSKWRDAKGCGAIACWRAVVLGWIESPIPSVSFKTKRLMMAFMSRPS